MLSAIFLRSRLVFCSTTNVTIKEKRIDMFAATEGLKILRKPLLHSIHRLCLGLSADVICHVSQKSQSYNKAGKRWMNYP